MWMALALAASIPLPAGIEADIACAATLQTALSKEKAAMHPALAAGMLYYIGRIEAAAPAIDANAAVAREQARRDFDKAYHDRMVRCVEHVTERMIAFDPKGAG